MICGLLVNLIFGSITCEQNVAVVTTLVEPILAQPPQHIVSLLLFLGVGPFPFFGSRICIRMILRQVGVGTTSDP